jgi:flavin reductase (DIM6/NTAB) family NADH-FMN oxidoreductase RutF
MLSLNLSDLKPAEAQNYLQHAIAPRPICFASTIDKQGQINLSPYSFFNLFSSNPPIAVFSPARRVRDNTTKHTLQNIEETGEVVINMVDYDLVQQMSLSSCEYPKSVNEFIKAGLTEQPATRVKPPMVKESKVKMECIVRQVIPLGQEGGAGNLVLAEILVLHIDPSILDANNNIDQTRYEPVARLGGNWYTRVTKDSLFEVEKPNVKLGIGFDQLPASVRNSTILTGNDLGMLANTDQLPEPDPAFNDAHVRHIVQYFALQPDELEKELHRYAQNLLREQKTEAAWQVLLTHA